MYSMTQSQVFLTIGRGACASWSTCIPLLQSTVLQEVWAKLYQLAYAHPDDGTPTASLKCRILPSLKPGAEMVFLMDLMSPGK